MLGHVNNVTYVDYLQEARVDLFRTHAPDSRADDLAEGVVVVRHEVMYLAQLGWSREPVSIECWVTEIRAASFTMAYEVFTEDAAGERTVYLTARTVLTPYVFATERPRRLREDERESLTRLLEPDEPVRAPTPPAVVDVPGGTYPIHVRFSDVDVYGHVNNVSYFEYFQEARIHLLSTHGREPGPRAAGEGGGSAGGDRLVVAHADVDYRRPILFRPEPYDCRTWISRVGSTSAVLEAVVLDGEDVLARSRVVVVFIDGASGRPTPVPDAYRALAVT